MIKGFFIKDVPWVEVTIGWEEAAQTSLAVLDTGFSGDLQITPKLAKELNLKSTTAVSVQIASGQIVDVPITTAVSSMEGEKQYVKVLISDSTPLLGITFLSKFSYKAIVDCKNRTVALKKA